MKQTPSSTRLVLWVALVVGLSIMGDSLMYSLLPLDAPALGIALPLVGVLLSANRWVRLLSNTWVAVIFQKYGARLPFFLSAVLGAMVAVLYGVGWGFGTFLLARVGWGIAWSGLRQGGYEAVWHGTRRGRLMGVLWGLVRLGSAVSVVLGGILRDRWGYRGAAQTIALFTVLALPVAWFIRWGESSFAPPETPARTVTNRTPWRALWRVSLLRWVLVAGFLDGLVDGVLISTASLFLTQRLGDAMLDGIGLGIGTVAGLMLASRFMSDVVFGPILGAVSDFFGQTATVLALAGLMVAGVGGAIFLNGAGMVAGLFAAFVAGSGLFVTLSAVSSTVATRTESPHLFVGAFTTANDAGMAVGPLLVYSLVVWISLPVLYAFSVTVFALSAWQLWRADGAI